MKRFVVPVVLLTAVALLVSACRSDASADEKAIGIHFSRFDPELITATVGQPVTITLRNDDPIAHEWIVGAEATHQRHRTGTDPIHATRPDEVSIAPFTTKVTTLTFDKAGDYLYICHLPGHEAYGMVGTLRVIEP